MFAIIKDMQVSYISYDEPILKEGETILEYSNVSNPFFDGEKIVEKEIVIPEKTEDQINKEIGYQITQEVFGGNPYAQLSDMVKSQIITLALLVPILGKETVNTAYADLISTVKQVSDARVANGLEPYDLSFLV